MKISVLAFASASDHLGRVPLALELPDRATTVDLRQALLARTPALAPLWPRLAVAVDGELQNGEVALRDGAEVALLPPVSGG